MREAYPPAAAQHLSQPAPHPSLSQSTLHQTSGERERKKERGKGERSEGEHTTTCTTRVSSPSANADAAPAGLSPINSSLSTSTAASNTTCKSRATSGKWEGERAEMEPLNHFAAACFFLVGSGKKILNTVAAALLLLSGLMQIICWVMKF